MGKEGNTTFECESLFDFFLYTESRNRKKINDKTENSEHCTCGDQETILLAFQKGNLGKYKVQITAVVPSVLFGMQRIQRAMP